MLVWFKLETFWKQIPPLRKVLGPCHSRPTSRLACVQACGMIYFLDWWLNSKGPGNCQWCNRWAYGPGDYNTASWISHEEQAKKQHSSMASPSKFLSWVSTLTFLSDRWQLETEINSFPPQVAFGKGVLLQQQKLSITLLYCTIYIEVNFLNRNIMIGPLHPRISPLKTQSTMSQSWS